MLPTNEPTNDNTHAVGSLLEKLLKNIERNTGKRDLRGKRHDTIINQFATAIYILAGPLAYEFIYANLQCALPSLRSGETMVQSQYSHINEGVIRFDELVEHIRDHGLPNLVSVAEDATRIIRRVEYDPRTNRCVG